MAVMTELIDTNSAEIATEFVKQRTLAGSPAMGMVMTLVVVVEEKGAQAALEAAQKASHEHPARVLGVILDTARGASRINAQVGLGRGWTGETALIRLRGEVVNHPESVVLPLLLPDSPVAVWWPADHPDRPAQDPLGALAQRRITDAAFVTRGKVKALLDQCSAYAKGNTDLAWTRITHWRALLAAALDQHPAKVTSAKVTAERISPSADLLIAWLSRCLKVPVTRGVSSGPGITEVVMDTAGGPIRIVRLDGKLARFSAPGRPDTPVALKRRELPDLLAEELRRLDEDDVYAASARELVRLAKKNVLGADSPKSPGKRAPAKASRAPAAKRAAKTPAKKPAAKTVARKIARAASDESNQAIS